MWRWRRRHWIPTLSGLIARGVFEKRPSDCGGVGGAGARGGGACLDFALPEAVEERRPFCPYGQAFRVGGREGAQ
eukprot:12923674-Prorocentrum_lima.AAC.1